MKSNQIKELFHFTKSERNGSLVLILIIIILLFFPHIYNFFQPDKKIDYSEFEKEIQQFEASLVEKKDDLKENRLDKAIQARYDTLELFPFNPNSTTEEQWKLLGMTEKQIKTINTYLERGGKFLDKNDFRKIYGIRPKQYEILKPYIELPDFVERKKNYRQNNNKNNRNQDSTSVITPQLFAFDPNTASAEDFKQLGLNEKQIRTIHNFISKGGKFKTKEDFKKIYGIHENLYATLEPYIEIKTNTISTKKELIEINSASFDEIKSIKGVGNYAKPILKFRDNLGGFQSKEQIQEVFGLKKEVYDILIEHITVDADKTKKIRLNFADINELKKHPYITFKEAKAILKYRDDNGPFKSIEQLIEKQLISEKNYEKVKNYLIVE